MEELIDFDKELLKLLDNLVVDDEKEKKKAFSQILMNQKNSLILVMMVRNILKANQWQHKQKLTR